MAIMASITIEDYIHVQLECKFSPNNNRNDPNPSAGIPPPAQNRYYSETTFSLMVPQSTTPITHSTTNSL